MTIEATKKCTLCEVEKSLEEFYRQSKCPDGRRPECKECNAKNRSRWSRPKSGYELAEEKSCPRCKQVKTAERFYKNACRRDHLSIYCKECTKIVRLNTYSKEKQRDAALKCTFGITRDDYNVMLAEQSGGCAICGTTTPGNSKVFNFSVDHDHETDEIRGLLCEKCNRGLGHFDDDPERLEAAARYLRAHSNKAASPKQSRD